MKSQFKKMVAILVLSAPLAAWSMPIVETSLCTPGGYGPGPDKTCVTGINNLTIDNSLYDVELVYGTGAEVFGDLYNPTPLPLFWQDQNGAAAAIAAIVAALNTHDVPTFGSSADGGSRYWIDVPWGSEGSSGFEVQFAAALGNGAWINSGTGSCGFVHCTHEVWAIFNTTSVPEPGTLGLLGLGMLGLVARRKLKS